MPEGWAMRVLLVQPRGNYPQKGICFDHLSQGFSYIGASLKAKKHEVYGLNFNFERDPDFARQIGNTIDEFHPQVICLSGLSAEFLFVRDMIRLIRKKTTGVPIILGGGLISADTEFVFSKLCPDIAVIGEGEETITMLLDCLQQGRSLDSVQGLVYQRNGELRFTGSRPLIANIDEVPFPDYELFDIESYFNFTNQYDNYFHVHTRTNSRLLPISGARGCPFRCTFCWHSTGPKYRQRSINNIVEEIAFFYERYQPNIFKLYDEVLSANETRVREFCRQINELDLDFGWSASMRVCDVSLDLLREMKNAGCVHIGYGFESASQKVLDSMKKGITVEQIKRAIDWTEAVGIGVQGTFIFGDLAETLETAEATRKFYLEHCVNHIVHMDYITPYPGSDIFRYCLEKNIISDKQWYYENINTRPRFNMTEMSDETFSSLIDPIVAITAPQSYSGFRFAEVLEYERDPAEGFDPPRENYRVTVRCPHCERSVEYLFPLEKIVRVRAFCGKCHKRFAIDLYEAPGKTKPFKPLVLGAPRSGFSLLINIVARLYPLTGGKEAVERRVMKAFTSVAGPTISAQISRVISEAGLENEFIYNDNFRLVVGGPYWLDGYNPQRICFRKYMGVRGMGDFTLITSHPREIADFYEIVHSHSHPEAWLTHSSYEDYIKLASIRHPADILASSCFSINALASEYIQRFIPPEQDIDLLRQGLALYKLSDLNFFEGLIAPLKSYLEEFSRCRDQFSYVMHWEDLIDHPVETILAVAEGAGIPVDEEFAQEIWQEMAYRNLTGAHKHNFRVGHGLVGGWLSSLTNLHIDCMRDNGLESYCQELGYGSLPRLNKSEYNAFQKKVDSYITAGTFYNNFPDKDLFEFAFNKSNLDFSRFSNFSVYDWREHTRIERSSFKDEVLLMKIWDAAEESVARFNDAYQKLHQLDFSKGTAVLKQVEGILKKWNFPVTKVVSAMKRELDRDSNYQDPVLIRSVGKTNIVAFAGRFYGLPQALGPINFNTQNVAELPGVRVAGNLSDLHEDLSRELICSRLF